MKRTLGLFLPPALVLAGLTLCCILLRSQTVRFRRSVEGIAEDVRVSLIDLDGKVVYDSTGQVQLERDETQEERHLPDRPARRPSPRP